MALADFLPFCCAINEAVKDYVVVAVTSRPPQFATMDGMRKGYFADP
jgi:hypothetical protein